MFRIVCFNLFLVACLTCCSKVDDYMLGKDNTPKPAELKALDTSKAKITQQWSVAVGSSKKGSSVNLKLKPVVVNHVVYSAYPNGVVNAVDSHKGELIWRKQLGSGISSGPALHSGILLVSSDASTVIALDQADGKELWRTSTSSDVLSKPVVAQNKVLAKTIDGHLYALDLHTGKILWNVDHGAPSLILKASSSPVVINNTVLTGYSDGKLEAVDLETGQVLWQKSIAYATGASDVERLVDIDADPIVQGDRVLLATYQGHIGAFSLSTGDYIWRKPASTFANLSSSGNSVYMTDAQDVVWSINKQNGQVNWKQAALKARGLTEPVLMGNRLIVGDKTGILHVISTTNGELIARMNVGAPITMAPTVVDNKIFALIDNGRLSRFSVS